MPTPDAEQLHPVAGKPGVDDATLIARMGSGDETALAMLYDRWASRLYSVSIQIVKQPDDAEDVLEETFWQVWRSARSYAPEQGSVATWLLTTTRNRSLDRLRAHGRAKDTPLETSYSHIEMAGDSAGQAGRGPDPAITLHTAIKDLPEEQREAFELAYFHGLSQAEIADRTGDPVGTVKTRMRLALQKLREELAPVRRSLEIA